MNRFKFALLLLLAPMMVEAHVVLDQPTAPANSFHKAVFRVLHGCDGSPTTRLTVFIPEGILIAKPMPKSGWSVEAKVEKLAKPFTVHGKPFTERISEITWSGGSLPEAYVDEFAIFVGLGDAGKRYFRVEQTCEKGKMDWSQIPEAGKSLDSYPTPAAVLEVTGDGKGQHKH